MNLPDFDSEAMLLGKGSFGDVYQSSDGQLAIKTYQNLQEGLHETHILKQLAYDQSLPVPLLTGSNNHCLKMHSYYYYNRETDMWIYQKDGETSQVVKQNPKWKDKMVLINMPRYKGSLCDLQHGLNMPLDQFSFALFRNYYPIYHNFIIHGDIKYGNILVDEFDYPVLCDFNISFRQFGCLLNQFTKQDLEYVQTISYRCPETILGGTNLSCKSELWSLGIVIFKLATGSVFFSSKTVEQQICIMVKFFGYDEVSKYLALNKVTTKLPERKYKSQKKRLLDQISNLDLRNLVSRLLTLDQNERLTLKEVFEHPYFETQMTLTGFQYRERDVKSYLDKFFEERHSLDISNSFGLDKHALNVWRTTLFRQVADFLYSYQLPINILFRSIYLFDFLVAQKLLEPCSKTFIVLVRIVGEQFYFSEHHAQLKLLSTLTTDFASFTEKILLIVWDYLELPSPVDYIYTMPTEIATISVRHRNELWDRLLEKMSNTDYLSHNNSSLFADL